ncbi:MAG: GT-D fold domain-containing glycosyltransferase, partial [Succinivibrio sp.]
DVFELSIQRKYIYGPRKHAWRQKDKIISEIELTVPKDWKLVFILGMAGKALIPEMVERGYVAWDIGHLAKSYDIYMQDKKVDEKEVRNFFKPD